MSPLKHSNNLAARMGRWSANHWKTAVFGWLAFVIASVFIGGLVVVAGSLVAARLRAPATSPVRLATPHEAWTAHPAPHRAQAA